MKPAAIVSIFAGVFLVATFATGFALALMQAGSRSSAGFISDLWHHALHHGWAAGVAVTSVFAILHRFKRN